MGAIFPVSAIIMTPLRACGPAVHGAVSAGSLRLLATNCILYTKG